MASKILFYRLKYKFLIINYIYMLHRKTRRLLPYQNEKVSCQNEKDGFQNGKFPFQNRKI